MPIIPSEILEGACCGVLKPYSFNIEIKSQDSILIDTKYFSSSKKPIYKKNEKTFYFKTKTGLSSIDFTYDEMISKDTIKIERTYKNVRYTNSVLINEKTYSDIENRSIIKKEQL
jgi:hypothetical protein